MLVFAVIVLTGTGRGAGLYAIVFALCGFVVSRYLPWRFAVVDEGIALWFAFERRLFLPKDAVTVRANLSSSVAYPRSSGASATRSPTDPRAPAHCCAPCSSSTASASPDDQPWAHCFAIGLGSTLKPTRSNQPAS